MKDLKYFKTKDFHGALRHFFKSLNIPVNYIAEEPARPRGILSSTYKDDKEPFQLMEDVYFHGMVDDAAFEGGPSFDYRKIESDYDGILIFGVTLNPRQNGLSPTRSHLAEITRAFNREFHYTPVVVVFRYGDSLAFANAERLPYKQEWREGEKAGKVSLLRDVDIDAPHSGHLRILSELSISRSGKQAVNSFAALYSYWQTVFNVSLLNKKFYEELSNWYFWAIKEVTFPGEPTIHTLFEGTGSTDNNKLQEARQEHNAKNIIRLLTRFLFVWFIKEKKLIPPELFDLNYVQDELVEDLSPHHQEDGLFQSLNKKSHYYKAILQNLFFATLNQEMGKRDFRKDKQHMNVTNLLRYETCFKNPQTFIKLVETVVPFMNGGLFECLDKPHPTAKGPRGGDVIIYEDGFSDRDNNPLVVPDYLFFGLDEEVDLSQVIGIANKKTQQAAVKGLINIFESYKFTIAENTPIEEDIALDPELLGKVFENLLASYNPETKTTARKQTGSFYTPREIVNYMVDESLIAYLKNAVPDWGMEEEELDGKLHQLLSFDPGNPFANNTALEKTIIKSLDNCAILDPACGSGAFPMGILQKMVHVLQKLDPDNNHWHELQMNKALKETESAFHLEDKEARKQKLEEINEAFDEQVNDPDYARKLFLIENCIYGVDIQPIATQISKLRFFISLVADQKVDRAKVNFGIRPLPNLETKFVAANTLIDIEKPERQENLFANREIKELEEELKSVRHRIFSAKTHDTKRKWRQKDKSLREKIGELLIADGWANRTAKQLAAWDPYDQNMTSPFFDPEWMFGMKDGFDVVIGNPPYIGQKGFNYLFVEIKRAELGKFHQRRMDYFYFFIHKGLDLIKNDGHLSLITTNYFYTATYADKLRSDIYKRSRFIDIIDFNEYKIFESALGQHNTLFLLKKCTDLDLEARTTVVVNSDKLTSNDITKILYGRVEGVKKNILQNKKMFDSSEHYIRLYSGGKDKILDLLESDDFGCLADCFQLVEGIHTGADKVSNSHIEKYGLNIEIGTGIYVLNDDERENLLLNQEEKEMIKPWYKNSDIKRWTVPSKTEKHLIYFTSKTKYKNVPEIKKHLDKFKKILINRKLRSGTGIITESDYDDFLNNKKYLSYVMNASAFKNGNYYCISYPREESVFENEKIIVPQRSRDNLFAYNNSSFYASADVYFIKRKKSNDVSLKYALSVLNSSLIYYWLFNKGKRKGDMLELYIRPLSQIPFKKDIAFEPTLISLSDINIFCSRNESDTALIFEKVNDALIFQLYFFDHMKEKQIDILHFVEKDLAEVMKGRDFEQLPDSEKQTVINQLHARWTHPDSEVRNRIKLFAVRSPDILKPILESR